MWVSKAALVLVMGDLIWGQENVRKDYCSREVSELKGQDVKWIIRCSISKMVTNIRLERKTINKGLTL